MLFKLIVCCFLALNMTLTRPNLVPYRKVYQELEDAIATGVLALGIEEGVFMGIEQIPSNKKRRRKFSKERSLTEFLRTCSIQAFINLIT